ncbi:Ltp family lipoprotein [Olsenella uli]|uniref:Ltp family lipoprotein n=1 Tax=Olsenella uli TaxID=133926 RepID=UPI001C9DB672|nr:Ltp family lipoprotein [Olsenella uli]
MSKNNTRGFAKVGVAGGIAAFAFAACLGLMACGNSSTGGTATSGTAAASSEAAASTEAATPDVPAEYTSALKKAHTYSDTMHMSKQGIYDQLVSQNGE